MPPEPTAPAATATPPAAPAAPASAAAPATPGTPATPAEGTPGAAAAPSNLVADAKPAAEGTAAPAAPAAPTKDEQLAFLTLKGVKAEDVAKLDEAGIKAKFDELKGADDRTAALTKMEIKVPEGAAIDEKALGAFKELAIDAKVSPEDAQKFFDMHTAAIKQATEGPVNLWMETQTRWQAAVKADPELGGSKQPQVEATIAKLLDSVGGEQAKAMRDAFVFTGAGNNPEIVRLMYRVGKLVSEAGANVNGKPVGEAKEADMQARLAKLYPSASDSKAAAP